MTLPVLALAAVLSAEPVGAALENVPYPYPVKFLALTLEGRDVRMAYMDVAPPGGATGDPVVLLHGKNFWGAYWARTIQALTAAGHRVVVPDQVGFGRSSKPELHYSFELLARCTHALLDELGIRRAAVVGHSMGGMLAVRFALVYPETTARLVLENPIGLEDYREKVPYPGVDATYRTMLAQTEDGIRRFYAAYFARWRDEFAPLGDAAARQTLSGEWPRVALASALTYDMIFTQPVVHDLARLRVPTLVVIGQEDRTVVGRNLVAKEVAATMGQYPELGRRAAGTIPGAKLVEVAGVGHIPHLEAPDRFERALIDFLAPAR